MVLIVLIVLKVMKRNASVNGVDSKHGVASNDGIDGVDNSGWG